MFNIEGIAGYWEAVRTLALLRLDELSKDEEKLHAEAVLLSKHRTVFDEIITDKSLVELEGLETEIDKILSGDQFTLDIDYWDFLLMMVKKQRAILALRKFFAEFKISQSERMKFKDFDGNQDNGNTISKRQATKQELEISIPFEEISREVCDDDMTLQEFKDKLALERTNTLDTMVTNFITDLVAEKIKDEKSATRFIQHVLSLVNENQPNEQSFKDEFPDSTGNHKLEFDMKSMLHLHKKSSRPEDNLLWMEEFKPRKPHYFNRVKLGYEWNKINQAHYTIDNPPPREVFGYKFNVFYPNLLDSSKVPSFKLLPTESPDLIIITFSAGPPYEDISFKIVNKQWDMADRKNFKCVFDRGVLSLFFDFVKNRHRR